MAVAGVHAGLDLRVDPQCGAFLHGGEQKSFEIEEHLIVPLAVPRGLVRDYGRKVAVAAAVEYRQFQLSKVKHLRSL